MDSINVDGFLDERSPAPSGSDLEYDPVFVEMEQTAQGKPEQQYGDTIIEAEPPDWKAVESNAMDVLGRSHDLRAAVYLATATLATRGLVSFAVTIETIKGYIEKYWDSFHPVLDPEDDNDPTIRVNALMSLCDVGTTRNLLSLAPLVRARTVGEFNLRDWRVANDEQPWPENSEAPKPELSHIRGAFQDCDLDELEQLKDAAQSLLQDVKLIEDLVTEQVGSAQSCNFETLVKDLSAIDRILSEQFSLRAPAASAPPPEPESEEGPPGEAGENVSSPAQLTVANLVIKSREEAINALEKICEYFELHEPSSPLPLLLRRARRLSTKSFLEIIQDISPDGMHQVASLGGLSDDNVDSSENINYTEPDSSHSSPDEY